MTWADPRAAWRRWYKANRKTQRQAKRMNRGREKWRGRFWKRIEIITLEGTMTGNLDDWIIRGVKGELYPCKPDIFAATYERV